jgi:hypothetical protein
VCSALYGSLMTTTREAGQSIESAKALEALMNATAVTSDARYEVHRLAALLKAAKATVKAAEAAEKLADAAYLATPYSTEA